jgi:transposase
LPLQSAMPPAGAAAAGRVLEISGQGEELLFMLFPHLRGLRAGQVEDTGDAVVIRACCRAAQARCPLCGAVSSRVHGGYARVVADGAAGGRPVLVVLSVRRFRCPDPSCPRATFAEQAGGRVGAVPAAQRAAADSDAVTPGRRPSSMSASFNQRCRQGSETRSPWRPEQAAPGPCERPRPHPDGTPKGMLSAC